MDRHHVDKNPKNNDRSNVRFLCRGCHQLEDGRAADRVREMADSRRGSKLSTETKRRMSEAKKAAHKAGVYKQAKRGINGQWLPKK